MGAKESLDESLHFSSQVSLISFEKASWFEARLPTSIFALSTILKPLPEGVTNEKTSPHFFRISGWMAR